MERVFVNGEHSSAIMKSMTRLWKERKYCDAVLEINSETVELHKLVLLAASPSIIDKVNDITERGTIVIKLDGDKYSKEAVKLCVQYLYKGIAKLTDTNVKSIARVAQALDIKEILKICSSFQDSFKLVKDENSTDNSDTEIESYSEDPEQLQENISTALQEALDNIKEIEENAKDDNTNMETQVEIQAEHEQITEINPLAIDSEPVAYDVKNEVESEKEEEIDMRNDDIAEKEVASAKDKAGNMEEQIEEDCNSEEFQPEEALASEEEFQGPLECSIKTEVSCQTDLRGKKFICNTCGRQYANRTNLNRHLKKHNDKFTFECKKCTQYFSTQDALDAHKQSRHSSKTHLCTSCGKVYGKRSHLTVHLRRFHQSEYLEPNLICPFENCSKSFQQKERYQDHLNVHDNVKPYSCSKCKREFHGRYYKNSHEKICTGKTSCKCDECDQVFCDKSSLARHKDAQHKCKVYVCSCGKTYLYENSLRKHKKSKHI